MSEIDKKDHDCQENRVLEDITNVDVVCNPNMKNYSSQNTDTQQVDDKSDDGGKLKRNRLDDAGADVEERTDINPKKGTKGNTRGCYCRWVCAICLPLLYKVVTVKVMALSQAGDASLLLEPRDLHFYQQEYPAIG
ncbi:hypothetical protein Tco_1376573 [Tanacetum coccineum]